jgi:hypothetical protein
VDDVVPLAAGSHLVYQAKRVLYDISE